MAFYCDKTEFFCYFLQLMDNLIYSNLPEIVVEVLMTLHETVNIRPEAESALTRFTGYSLLLLLLCVFFHTVYVFV